MPSDYEGICEDNIRRRGSEFDDIGRLISEQLYSDRSHFIYELLQNAEDALERRFKENPENNFPRKVQFRLFHDRLEFRHYGILFTEEDVKGISDVLKGTKQEDLMQIGKFGIGFKAVYGFTSSPEVHSGDEHFVIKRYIRPEAKEPRMKISEGETVFNFPFDHQELTSEKAFQLILEKLETLGPRVLLFLRHIGEIEWSDNSTAQKGQYLKKTKYFKDFKQARRITVIGQKNGEDGEESWLIFEKKLATKDTITQLNVEIGFRIERSKQGGEQIVRVIQAPLVAYFPTEIDTHLGFLVQGPYRTTPARDNISKDGDWNKRLIQETASLVEESLVQLKKMGFMSMSLLWALPIRRENFSLESMFAPIVTQVANALKFKELLPADDGTFVAAKKAKMARGEGLRKLLSPVMLQRIFNNQPGIKWLSGKITEARAPELRHYLMEQLEVEEIRPEDLAERLSEKFLSNQSDDWLIELYKFFLSREELWKKPNAVLRRKKILRLQSDKHVKPFKEDGTPNAYFPSSVKTNFPIVKASICKDQDASEFLKRLGIIEPDLFAEIIEFVLPKYEGDVNVSLEENIEDLEKIKELVIEQHRGSASYDLARLRILLNKMGLPMGRALYDFEKPSQLISPFFKSILPSIRLLLANNGIMKTYREPKNIYFKNNDLIKYFDGNSEAWFLSDEYPDELTQLFNNIGVNQSIRTWVTEPDRDGFVVVEKYRGRHRRGLDYFDPTMEVDGLEHALASPTFGKSQFIWNNIALNYSACIRGIIETATRQTYENSEKEERISEFGDLLINSKWLPDRIGNMHFPSELCHDELPDSFKRDEFLAKQLEMKMNVAAQLAQQCGVDIEDIEYCRKFPEEFKKWKESIAKKVDKPVFPKKSIGNPERREEKLGEQIGGAPGKTYEKRERSVRVSSGTIDRSLWLKNYYTNESGEMICQICKEIMPFLKRDGEYYFEAVEAFSKDNFNKEYEAQYLALCPLCAAMYKEFIKKDENAMSGFKERLINSEDLEMPLKLGELETSIRFVESHHHDMKTILNHSH